MPVLLAAAVCVAAVSLAAGVTMFVILMLVARGEDEESSEER